MSIFSEAQARLRKYLRWVMHPYIARKNNTAEPEPLTPYFQEAMDSIAVLRASEDTWHKIASDPGSTTEALQQVIAEENHAYDEAMDTARMVDEFPRTEFEDTLGRLERWRSGFMSAIAAHPNVTVELLSTLEMRDKVVASVLSNPVLPFLLLERPDFLEALDKEHPIIGRRPDKQIEFARQALLHEELPATLLTMCTRSPSFWLALEAQTHVAAEDSGTPAVPDLEWLEAQIMNQLRADTPPRRILVYELGCYSLLPKTIEPVPPWQPQDSSYRAAASAHPNVRKLVERTHQLARHEPEYRERVLCDEIRQLKYDIEDGNALALRMEIALFHPKTAPWVSDCIAKGWPWSQKQGRVTPFCRLMTLVQGKASPKVTASLKAMAIHDVLEYWGELERFQYNSPGILYFLMCRLPDILEGNRLGKLYRGPYSNVPIEIKSLPFLLRLAIAFRLEDTELAHREWRTLLCNDPNRYVRVAARKEIAWPKSEG